MSGPSGAAELATWLEFEAEGQAQRLALLEPSLTIGRQSDCAIVLRAEAVSRRHARLDRDAGRWWIRDLGSRNGTAVNGVYLTGPRALADGDVIAICGSTLCFRTEDRRADPRVRVVDGVAGGEEILSTMTLVPAGAGPCALDPVAALDAVLAITRELGGYLELDQLLRRVLDHMFTVYPQAAHGAILLLDAQGELVPAAVKSRHGAPELQISRTVLERAMRQREAILSADAAHDAQLGPSHSLIALPIRSLMCVPLIGRDNVPLGAIELHTEAQGAPFTASCLDLLRSVASAAAVAIDNARLHEKSLAQDRLQRDLQHAREVQRSFLPERAPVLPGYRFFVHYEPAQAIGGDYYSFLELPNDRIAVGVGDVTGKGLPAALMMARLSSDVRSALLQTHDAAAALALVNHSLAAARLESRFVTFLLMLLDRQRHRLGYANAGHYPPLLRRARGAIEPLQAGRAGIPLNISEDPRLLPVPGEADLEPGACILAFTDGLTEAADAHDEPFGDDRVRAALAANGGDPERTGAALIEQLRTFTRGRAPHDDVTIVCFAREP